MSNYNYVIKDLSGKVLHKSIKKYVKASEALTEGDKKYKENTSQFPKGSYVDLKNG